jgi:hypothetical protein
LVLNVFQIAFFIDLVLNLTHYYCHLVCNDAFVLRAGHLASLILLVVEISLLPSLIIANLGKNGLVLLQVKEAAIDFHKIFSKCRFGDEDIRDKSLSCLQEAPISNVFLPDAKDLGDCIAFEEANVSDDIEQRRLVHPV